MKREEKIDLIIHLFDQLTDANKDKFIASVTELKEGQSRGQGSGRSAG